jgi:Glycosyl transferase family 2
MSRMSIVIPAKGRPHYTRNAVFSVMRQDFDDFDVTLSNNGADPAVKAAVAEFIGNPRFHYIEHANVLDMPSHWELASRAATGDYLLILTNRSVLKQGVLQKLSRFLKGESGDVELVSWRWDSYDSAKGLLSPCPFNTSRMLRFSTSSELTKFATEQDIVRYTYVAPRGMNSCVSRSVVERIRDREGRVFQKINPDYKFGFSCLLNASELIHFEEAFYIADGLEVSNGINAVAGDVRPYVDSLGLADPWRDTPIKAGLIHNTIVQDFLATVRKYGRDDILAKWNRSLYYLNCFGEIQFKRKMGILSTLEIDELKEAVEVALQNEDESVRVSVAPPIVRRVINKMIALARIVVRSAPEFAGPHRRQSAGGDTYRTALEAAGFEH